MARNINQTFFSCSSLYFSYPIAFHTDTPAFTLNEDGGRVGKTNEQNLASPLFNGLIWLLYINPEETSTNFEVHPVKIVLFSCISVLKSCISPRSNLWKVATVVVIIFKYVFYDVRGIITHMLRQSEKNPSKASFSSYVEPF